LLSRTNIYSRLYRKHYDQFNNWVSEFGNATPEERKMIVYNLIREVKVSRGYELDVVMDMNYE